MIQMFHHSLVRGLCVLVLVAMITPRSTMAAANQPPTFVSSIDNATDQNQVSVKEDSGLHIVPHFLTEMSAVESRQSIIAMATTNDNNALFGTQPFIVRPAGEP